VDKPTIAYCWSGAQSSLNWYVMHELLGNKNARLYDGSMQEWSKNPNNPMTSMKLE
jgi:thiosulfate/3-mercaptopyruvate sulfurtransferase